MPITTAQLKAAIEAKIAAANGSTTLEDLTLLKANADLWLLNNAGTITGYASLEALIQTRQNALTGSSSVDDISYTSASAFPVRAPVPAVRLAGPQALRFNAGLTPAGLGQVIVTGVDASSALTTVFLLSGRYVMPYLILQGINATLGSLRIQLIVDGLVVLDVTESGSSVSSVNILNAPHSAIQCNSSIEIRMTKPLSTSVGATYIALAVL
jgi:hypothetical protein